MTNSSRIGGIPLLMVLFALVSLGCRPAAPPSGTGTSDPASENASAPHDASAEDGAPAAAEGGSTTDASGRLAVAFVTNQHADFWEIARAGCMDAQKEFDVEVIVKMPDDPTAVEQKRIVEDLLTSGVKGIAISPIAADDQVGFLNDVAAQVPLITHDSDAPGSNRLAYIGMDNYKAGRMCGELVKQALPDGGKVVLFIGRLEQDNSKYRRQGVIDELLDREAKAGANDDPVDQPIQGDKYTILTTLTDQGKPEVAKQKAEDAINAYSDLNAMVGLFEYNPPACFEAIRRAGKLGQIKLIGFDENDVTLQAIKDGHCVGTIVQNPFEYGHRSVEILASILRGDKSALEQKFIDIPPRKVTSDNVDAYWDDLKNKKSGN